jgi:hypothetical protein
MNDTNTPHTTQTTGCPCCPTALFFEIGGVVYPALSTGPTWNGFLTPTVTRDVAQAMAANLSAEQGQAVMYLEGDTLVLPDLENGYPADRITPNADGSYSFGFIGWCFTHDDGPATYDQEATR